MSKNKFIVVWKNIYSSETGFVAHIKKDHFENTYAPKEARTYPSEVAAYKAIAKLEELGEGKVKNNTFSVEQIA